MALTKDDLQAIASLIDSKLDEKLSPVNERLDNIDKRFDGIDERLDKVDERLDGIEERLDKVEENTEITRSAVNTLLEWTDTYWRNDFDKPFPPKEKDIV